MEKQELERPNIKGDRINFIVLMLMYMLLGALAGGITAAIPIILENRKASYADQAEYSISGYPYCFKLLWAPVIDCMYSKKLGRRKCWLVPTQYLIGITLLFVSWYVDDLLGTEDGVRKPKIHLLTVTFLTLVFLITVLDVALDGWSLTMLQKRNIGYVGTCLTVGGSTGGWITQVLLVVLDSKDFCNMFRSVPQDHGFVNLSTSLFSWAVIFLVSTTLILVFKKENGPEVTEGDDDECRVGLKESYVKLWKVLKIRPIIAFSLILLTSRIAFGPSDGVAPLKIMTAGVSKENFVLFTFPTLPVQIVVTLALAGWLTGPRAMRSFLWLYIIKVIWSLFSAVILFLPPYLRDENDALPAWYYWLLFFTHNAKSVMTHLMTVSILAYFCRVSDPRYGGIYLTLFWTIFSIGERWTLTLSLYLVDVLTMKTCTDMNICFTKLDGFYVETIICTVFGVLWLFWGRREIYKLEKLKALEWLLVDEQSERTTLKDESRPMVTI